MKKRKKDHRSLEQTCRCCRWTERRALQFSKQRDIARPCIPTRPQYFINRRAIGKGDFSVALSIPSISTFHVVSDQRKSDTMIVAVSSGWPRTREQFPLENYYRYALERVGEIKTIRPAPFARWTNRDGGGEARRMTKSRGIERGASST